MSVLGLAVTQVKVAAKLPRCYLPPWEGSVRGTPVLPLSFIYSGLLLITQNTEVLDFKLGWIPAKAIQAGDQLACFYDKTIRYSTVQECWPVERQPFHEFSGDDFYLKCKGKVWTQKTFEYSVYKPKIQDVRILAEKVETTGKLYTLFPRSLALHETPINFPYTSWACSLGEPFGQVNLRILNRNDRLSLMSEMNVPVRVVGRTENEHMDVKFNKDPAAWNLISQGEAKAFLRKCISFAGCETPSGYLIMANKPFLPQERYLLEIAAAANYYNATIGGNKAIFVKQKPREASDCKVSLKYEDAIDLRVQGESKTLLTRQGGHFNRQIISQ